METLAAIRLFTRVMETESFSEAVRQLGLAPSSVSRQIGGLEDELGVRLLNRTTRKLSATEAGLIYYQRVVGILDDAEAARYAVSDLEATPKGTLRVTVPISFGRFHVATALSEFFARYPSVQVDMSASDNIVDLIAEGFDLAIRTGNLKDSNLIARRLAPVRLVICASPSYLERNGVPQSPADLADHNCMTFEYHASGKFWRFDGPGGAVKIQLSGNLHTDNGEILHAAVLGGAGLALLPIWQSGSDIQAGRLKTVLDDFRVGPSGGIYALYPHNRHLAPKVRAFVDFLAARFGPEPYWDARGAGAKGYIG